MASRTRQTTDLDSAIMQRYADMRSLREARVAPLLARDGEPGAGGGSGAGAGTGTGTPSGTGGGSGWKAPASQDELDQIIETRLARERVAFRREIDQLAAARGSDPKEREELEALRKEKVERERKAQEERGQYDRALDSVRKEHETEREKIAREKEELLTELRQTRCNDALLAAASDAGAINARQVARLLEANVKLNDKRQVVVLDDQGEPWLKGGKNIAIADLMEKFSHDNPHLFKAPAGAGAGSAGGASTSDTGAEGIEGQIAAAQEAYDKAHAAAEASGGAMPDVTKARQARRELDRLIAEKKKKSA